MFLGVIIPLHPASPCHSPPPQQKNFSFAFSLAKNRIDMEKEWT